MAKDIAVRFLGVGDASQEGLGHASACVECGDAHLLIDCGPGVLDSYRHHYQGLPDALFITHCHLDHIADFEKLFIKCWFASPQHKPKIFVPAAIVPLLHERIATYPGALAEGGVNFWDAFQLIPVSHSFEYLGHTFCVYPARHHGLNSAFSLSVHNVFFYTGDTRPIPEILEHAAGDQSCIFHDCSLIGNPSHSGVDDLLSEYTETTRERLWVYHYNSASQRQAFQEKGLRCINSGQVFTFHGE